MSETETAEGLASIGHNSGEDRTELAVDRLRSLVERIERLEQEKKDLGVDIKDIYSEAKSAGFDTKVLRQLISIRRKDPDDVESEETQLDVYRRALGM